MNRKDFKQVEKEKQKSVQLAVQALTDQENGDISAYLDRIKAYDELIRYYKKKNNYIWPAIFSCFVFAAIILSIIPCPWTKLELKAKCDAISFRLSESWEPRYGEMDNIDYSQIQISNLNHIEVPWTKLRLPSSDRWVAGELTGSNINISVSSFDKNGWFLFERHPSDLKLAVKDSTVEGIIYSTEAFRLHASYISGTAPSIDTSFPGDNLQSFKFSRSNTSRLPTVFHFHPPQWRSINMPVNTLSFNLHESDQKKNIRMVSHVLEGELKIPEISKTLSITEGQIISFNEAIGEISSLHVSDHIEVAFEGRTRKITVGSKVFMKNFTPSILEYLYHQNKQGFFLSALLGIWSMLCIFRQLFSQ